MCREIGWWGRFILQLSYHPFLLEVAPLLTTTATTVFTSSCKGSGCFPFHFALLAFILAVPPCSLPLPSFTAVPMPATPPPLLHPLLMVIFPLLHLPHHLSDISKLDVIRSVPCIRWVLLSSVGPLWFLHIPSLLHPLLLVAMPLLTCLLTWLH